MKLSIIIPMYNSEDIGKNIHAAINALNEVTRNYEIILVVWWSV